MKIKKIKIFVLAFLVLTLIAVMLSNCTPAPKPSPSPTGTATTPPTASPTGTATAAPTGTATASLTASPTGSVDVVTTASIVADENALANALSKNGTWIICTIKDMNTTKELVMEGDFHDKNDPKNPLYRKLALYAQDANHNVTARYMLTAPKLTIKSPNAKIQGGTFKGDVYVQANGFTVQDATIDGNVYFASEEFKKSFVLPTAQGQIGKVTGKTEVKK